MGPPCGAARVSACLTLMVLVACAGGGPPAGAPDRDAWLAEDKVRHFVVSAAATTLGYGAARFGLDHDRARTAAASVAFGLGIAKEMRDARRGGPFSLKDLAWDAAGVGLGLLLLNGMR